MTKPLLGEKARVVFVAIEQALVEAQSLLFNAVVDVYEGEKGEATDELRQIAELTSYAARLATLARANQLTDAETMIMDRTIQKRKPNHE